MEIKLKFKHLQYIAFYLRSKNIGTAYSDMFMAMRSAVKPTIKDETEVSLTVQPDWIKQVWQLLGNKPEKEAAVNNREISDAVEAQLQAIIAGQEGYGITEKEVQSTDGNGDPVVDEDSNPVMETIEILTPERQLANDLEGVKADAKERVQQICEIGKSSLL